MANPLQIPSGTVFAHNDTRIAFVEAVDDCVLRFVIEGTSDEYFQDIDGIRVRFTVPSLLNEFAEGRLRDFATSEKTLSEWNGRFLGLDRAAIFERDPWAITKYDIALGAILQRLPRNAARLQQFAKGYLSDPARTIPSGRSVIRWMNNLEDNDLRIGALKNRSGRQKGTSPLPPIVDRIVHQSVALYFSSEALKKMDAHALSVHAWCQHQAQGTQNIGKKPPSKTTVINRINACETRETYSHKFGRHEADRHFLASGNTTPVSRPFELVYMDGVEYEQICHFSAEATIPSAKLKSIWLIDSASLYVFPSTPFAGPYRSEMGMGSLLGALTPPALDSQTMRANPMLALAFGRIGLLRTDNDRALMPPSAIGNIANVVNRVELAKRYGPDEKAIIENFNGFLMRRLDGLAGTVLSARSRRRSIRRDPLAEASLTRADFCRFVEGLRLEWNDMGHKSLGGRTPNEIMQEHLAAGNARFNPSGEVRRNLARTVSGVLTTDGLVFDNIRYSWNRTGVTNILSRNISAQQFATRLEGTARCDVSIRVYDWNLDFIEVLNESNNEFVMLWSDDPEYTEFLTRYEHRFYQSCMNSGATGAQTGEAKALRRAEALLRANTDLRSGIYSRAKKAATILELDEMRAKARNLQNDPDLTNLAHLFMPTEMSGQNRADIPKGPKQSRNMNGVSGRATTSSPHSPDPDWGGLDPAPRSNLQMLELQHEEDLDGGIDWEVVEASDSAGHRLTEQGD